MPCPRLEDSTIFEPLKISLENARNLAENLQRPFFWFLQVEIARKKIFKDLFRLKKKCWEPFFWDCLKKNFENLFFWRTLASVSLVLGLGLERVCPWPWPREGLSLASKFFVSLALASSLVSSTPPLHTTADKKQHLHYEGLVCTSEGIKTTPKQKYASNDLFVQLFYTRWRGTLTPKPKSWKHQIWHVN